MSADKPARPPRRAVDGVLLLDKPAGMSSNAALQTARRLLNARKAGHTGTLDPLASGLLPLTFGEAAKFAQMLLDAGKVYEAGVRLGIETDSGDAEGAILATRPVTTGEAELRQTLARFTGDIAQTPPMHSALKRDGKPLYEYARAGIEIARAPRQVTISELTLLAFEGERFTLRVACSKGTYIRTLATDIGAALGCGAHLDALRRTHVGVFDLTASITLETLEAASPAQRDALLAPVDTLAAIFPRLDLDDGDARRILQGQPLRLPRQGGENPGDRVRLYGPGGFLGLGQWKEDGGLWPKRLVCPA
ncbi:MAG: tRNA pseudouridine(55) synthase TruB [Azoarcus sp.]|jgi:tRNA pseudouridine55 synthase|nr:tRNA pseudouridine(55) synthase TruB [Azoarcus sp.]